MATQAQRITALEDQVATLAVQVRGLLAEALAFRILSEMPPPGTPAALAGPPRRPRHLQVVREGAS
jgi:hypothetical protein